MNHNHDHDRPPPEGESQSKKSKNVEPDETIEAALDRLAVDPKEVNHISSRAAIRKVKTRMDGREGSCYFVTDGSIKFRHQGSDRHTPDVFFLKSRRANSYLDKVVVQFSASGSGKTVDLAGSSVSRGAHLTIIVAFTDGAQDFGEDTGQRNEASLKLLQ